MTVMELIEALEECEPEAQVRLAMQPSWAMEYTINSIGVSEDTGIVYLSEGTQLGYLPGDARRAVSWEE